MRTPFEVIERREVDTNVRSRGTVRAALVRRDVLVPFVVSRVLADGLIALMAASTSGHLMRQGFAKWDGRWYTAIANVGYSVHFGKHGQTAWAFFPLLSGLIRVLNGLGIPRLVGGALISHFAFLLALFGLHRLLSRRFSPRATRLAIWLLALFPASIVFSMVYPSSIFLAAAVWGFVFVDEHHDLAAGMTAVVATLARPNGIVLALALACAVGFRFRRLLQVCGPAALALGAWMLYNFARTGDWLRFFSAKGGWGETNIVNLFALRNPGAWIHLLLAVVAVGAVVAARKRMPSSWLALTALYLLPSLALGIVGLGRYANECFPVFAAGGDLLERRGTRARVAVFATLIAGQVLFAYWVIALGHLP